ncbi:MAG: zinc ribbon domain-containing protein [Promethearchaeota archaeon]
MSPGIFRLRDVIRRRFVLKRGLIGSVWRRVLIGSMVVVAISGTPKVIKLPFDDLEKVEEEVGKSVEDMTEDELRAGMKKLGIKEHKLTSEDKEKLVEEIKFCANCGASIELGDKSCPYCGHEH